MRRTNLIRARAGSRIHLTAISILLFQIAFTMTRQVHAAEATQQFDGQRAYRFLLTQVGFGPRIPESDALEKTRNLILHELTENGFSTGTQDFTAYAQVLGRNIRGRNIYGVFPPGAKAKYVVSAHYDTRPIADREEDPDKRRQPIPGANDGASGVAVLLEMARAIAAANPKDGIGLIFFDAEDLGKSADSSGFCLGSRYLAENLPPELHFEAGVNLDMVGDSDLRLPMEGFSLTRQSELMQEIWAIGQQIAPAVFVPARGPAVFDDHIPFLQKGMRYVNIIDFEYPHWHTLRDSADKCSARSLQTVGEVILRFVLK